MKVKALRGVCIGVDRHLKAGDIEDLDPGLVTFLVGIGAVEKHAEPPAPPPEPPAETPPAPEPETPPPSEPPPAKKTETAIESTPAKPGRKEK